MGMRTDESQIVAKEEAGFDFNIYDENVKTPHADTYMVVILMTLVFYHLDLHRANNSTLKRTNSQPLRDDSFVRGDDDVPVNSNGNYLKCLRPVKYVDPLNKCLFGRTSH